MMSSQVERSTRDEEGMRLYQQERLILEATMRICELMEEQGVSRTELARRLGTSKGHVTQLLDGGRNMTLRTLSDIFMALDRAAHVQDGSLAASVRPLSRPTGEWSFSWDEPASTWAEKVCKISVPSQAAAPLKLVG